ncbi:MAG: amidohydrolase [Oscillospiraceae bacterium]|jgi:amidohydrolase|nr:amidohydrolase [Oscillospiraceae bacterium]
MHEMDIKQRAVALEHYVIEARRALHRIPEEGFSEVETNALLRRYLDEIGVPYTGEKTWLIAEITGGKPGKTVGIRADIDALPLQEETGLPFASEHPGWMHACGHDMHAAILLGTAKLLWAIRDEIPGRVRLFFQPAEETDGGAEPMIAAGAMQGVDAVYALHVAAQAPVGRIACKAGPMYAACDTLHIDILGRKGHGAHPRSGTDAIVIAAQVITALQTLITRELEATEAAILTIGAIHGGTAQNILCDEVKLFGTMRTLDMQVRAQLRHRLPLLITGIAQAMGGDARVEIEGGYAPTINDDIEAARVLSLAERLFGADKIKVLKESSMGGEDFGYFTREAPGALYHLGTGSAMPLHNGQFNPDEACMVSGVTLHAALALDYLGGLER